MKMHADFRIVLLKLSKEVTPNTNGGPRKSQGFLIAGQPG